MNITAAVSAAMTDENDILNESLCGDNALFKGNYITYKNVCARVVGVLVSR